MELSSVSHVLETMRRDFASIHWSWITVTYLHSFYYDPLERELVNILYYLSCGGESIDVFENGGVVGSIDLTRSSDPTVVLYLFLWTSERFR